MKDGGKLKSNLRMRRYIANEGDRMGKKPVYEKQFEHLKTVKDSSDDGLMNIVLLMVLGFSCLALLLSIWIK